MSKGEAKGIKHGDVSSLIYLETHPSPLQVSSQNPTHALLTSTASAESIVLYH
jgi:hypothetical protein